MKISFECECALLQKSLLLFCPQFVSSRKDCDFIVSDHSFKANKPLFLIAPNSPHLSEPFDKKILINRLLEFYSAIQIKPAFTLKEGPNLQTQISDLVDKFKKDLLEILKSQDER